MDNIVQAEELEVLQALFGEEWKYNETTGSYIIKITENAELWINLSPDYPSKQPPKYEVWAPSLTKNQRDLIDCEFKSIYEMSKGEPVIYQWIEKFKDIVLEEKCEIQEDSSAHDIISNKELEISTHVDVIHGSIITDRKSTFQGHVCRISSPSDINNFLEILHENRKIAQATHNILAYRLNCEKAMLQDCDDDGENHAGSRLLHLLQILELQNIAVVVTRWYGGIHLGPDRFKHINNAARQVLSEGGFIK